MKYFILDPEVPGGLGPNTLMDRSVHPPIITKLHFEMDGWMGDDIVQSFPCYLATERLKARMEEIKASGLTFAHAEITASDTFEVLNPARKLPMLFWMKISGEPGADDLGLTPDARLVASKRVLDVMNELQLNHCEVVPFK